MLRYITVLKYTHLRHAARSGAGMSRPRNAWQVAHKVLNELVLVVVRMSCGTWSPSVCYVLRDPFDVTPTASFYTQSNLSNLTFNPWTTLTPTKKINTSRGLSSGRAALSYPVAPFTFTPPPPSLSSCLRWPFCLGQSAANPRRPVKYQTVRDTG